MEKRVLIVDFNHRAHMYMNSSFRPMVTVMINGEAKTIDTSIQNGFIKDIYRWSNGGFHPTVVCFDSPVPVRKAYFAKNFDMPVGTVAEYKGGREKMSELFFESITMTKSMLDKAGVTCIKANNYEADDLIFACIKKAKAQYPGMPIDVMTNDADLIPLVDDTVSVFLRSKKGTEAESPEYERLHYVQVTPKNYQRIVEGLSNYKKFEVPYNTLLLHKLLRGDSSDNIGGVKKRFPPKVYNSIIEQMRSDWVDIYDAFRYGENKVHYEDLNGNIISLERAKELGNQARVFYEDPEELTRILDVFSRYNDDEEVLTHIRKAYLGMNLNQAYIGYGNLSRRPARITKDITGFSDIELQRVASELSINLNLRG